MQESNSSPVINTKRRHSAAFKRKILELTEQSGASVAAVALEHGVNANLVFKWRRARLERKRSPRVTHQPLLLPVSVDSQESFLTVPATHHQRDPAQTLRAMPLHAVGEIHLTGDGKRVDPLAAPLGVADRDAPVEHAVWDLYELRPWH